MEYMVCNRAVSMAAAFRLSAVAAVWLAGFAFGAFSGSSSDPSFSMMLQLSQKPMSIVGLLGVICLPYLLTAFAVYFHPFYGILFAALVKAFSFGYVSVFMKAHFGGLYWLPKGMLMFTDLGCITILGMLWHRILHGDARWRSLLKAAAISFAIGMVDITVVAPLLEASGLF